MRRISPLVDREMTNNLIKIAIKHSVVKLGNFGMSVNDKLRK